jgi:hypothetical protein
MSKKLANKAGATTEADFALYGRLLATIESYQQVANNSPKVIQEPILNLVAVHRWVLAEGRFFAVQKRPRGFKLGKPRECYANASTLALVEDDLAYCEGIVEAGLPLLIEHGWCVRDGRVIEVTLKKPALSYFGVLIDLETLAQAKYLPVHETIIKKLMSKARRKRS